jgi:hypothetical protein
VTSVAACGTVRVRFRVRNTGLANRQVFVAATGPGAGSATGNPATAVIGALETGELVAEITPADRTELILWVRGFRDHAVRCTVHVRRGCGDREHIVRLDDGPCDRHEWHDHFAQP